MAQHSFAGSMPAPEFPPGLDWLNTSNPLTMAHLRGKVVILDFWTYGCINCMHIIPDLKQLEAEYPDELVVIGVHSAKFRNEGDTDNIRQIILRYDIEHPVVNDHDFLLWQAWGVRAWPTLAVIDPAGKAAGTHSGEGAYRLFKPVVQSLVQEFDQRGLLDRTPLRLKLEKTGLPETVLSFPGKVLADAAEGRLFISDTNHHRIIITDIESGHVLHVIGRGKPGFADGDILTATFAYPQGLALSTDGQTLYVADTGNHAVRRVDLATDVVTTLVGTGEQSQSYPPRSGKAPEVALNSPWDLALDGSQLYIAMAGAHQIWGMDLPGGFVGPLVGSGREGTLDSTQKQAELAQTSGLALDGAGRLYFADSEGSAVRWTTTSAINGRVGTLAGSGESLFDFGDTDGTGRAARFQHPLGVVFHQGMLYVADTYNSKIKRIDPASGQVTTLFGNGHGWCDGANPLFYEPGGITAADNRLYIADTNNHAIRVADLESGQVSTLMLRDLHFYMVHTNGTSDATDLVEPSRPDDALGRFVHFDPIMMGTGNGKIIFHLTLPDGYKINNLVSHNIEWYLENTSARNGPQKLSTSYALHRGLHLPLEIGDMTLIPGESRLYGHLTIFYCEEQRQGICLVEQLRVTAPLIVIEDGPQVVELHYAVQAPEGQALQYPGGLAV